LLGSEKMVSDAAGACEAISPSSAGTGSVFGTSGSVIGVSVVSCSCGVVINDLTFPTQNKLKKELTVSCCSAFNSSWTASSSSKERVFMSILSISWHKGSIPLGERG
jgi:hypothetical protein